MSSTPIYKPNDTQFHFTQNATLATLTSANAMANAISATMIQMVNIYLVDSNANTAFATQEQQTVTALMQGGVSDNFDGNNSKNDPAIWKQGSSPNTNSSDMNMVQADVQNCESWFKSVIGIVQAMLSSGTSGLQTMQQNETQEFTYMNTANQLQDFLASLLSSPLV